MTTIQPTNVLVSGREQAKVFAHGYGGRLSGKCEWCGRSFDGNTKPCAEASDAERRA